MSTDQQKISLAARQDYEVDELFSRRWQPLGVFSIRL